MEIAVLFIALFALIILGLPVAIALAGSSAVYVLVSGSVPSMMVSHRMINGVDSFPLLAVLFFILAGNLMNTAGITERIFKFALSLVGWMHSGLGHVNVGAAVADAGGPGAIEIQAMKDAKYDPEFAVGITATSSTIGPIIPPSLLLLITYVPAITLWLPIMISR